MKIHPVGAELLHADGQTDKHDEANSRFSQFCECALRYLKVSEVSIAGSVAVPRRSVLVRITVCTWGRHECFINGRFLCFR